MNGPTAKQIEVLKIVAAWADRFPCIRNVFVFGSFIRGVQMPQDIDIAIDYTDDVAERIATQCYIEVNTCSMDLERSLSSIVSVRVGWTGLAVLSEGYDQKAWDAIHAGKTVHCHGKAQMIWTAPVASNRKLRISSSQGFVIALAALGGRQAQLSQLLARIRRSPC
jgi:predicted nucleotidyltransferase